MYILVDLFCVKSGIFMEFLVLIPSPICVIFCNQINDSLSDHINLDHQHNFK